MLSIHFTARGDLDLPVRYNTDLRLVPLVCFGTLAATVLYRITFFRAFSGLFGPLGRTNYCVYLFNPDNQVGYL